jgi:hypothetical protein
MIGKVGPLEEVPRQVQGGPLGIQPCRRTPVAHQLPAKVQEQIRSLSAQKVLR